MHHAAVILDLDGVVYIGPAAVPHAIEALNRLAAAGVVLSAATNNANRPAPLVAAHLHELGLHIQADRVMTSAQAAGHHLARALPAGAPVLAIGGDGVAQGLLDAGLTPLRASADLEQASAVADAAQAVLIGYGPLVAWFDLAAGHWAIERGKPWYATNTDPTVPLPFGKAPGNGAMVGLLRTSTGVAPTVIGKPQPALFHALVEHLGTRDALVIGDRLDTDIDGALAAGLPSLLVCTGVHGPADLLDRPASTWPDYIAQDLRSLQQEPVDPRDANADGHPLVAAVRSVLQGQAPASWEPTDAASPLLDLRAARVTLSP